MTLSNFKVDMILISPAAIMLTVVLSFPIISING
jgi:hypothetical protein